MGRVSKPGMGDGIVRFDELGLWLSVRDLCVMEGMESPHLFRERTPGERPLPVICCGVGIDNEKTEVTWHTKRAAWSLELTMLNSTLLGHTMLALSWGKKLLVHPSFEFQAHMPNHCQWGSGS